VLLYGVTILPLIAYLHATPPAAYNSLTYFAVGVIQTFANILSDASKSAFAGFLLPLLEPLLSCTMYNCTSLSATISANSADVGVPGFADAFMLL
jgi:hypothetical protein